GSGAWSAKLDSRGDVPGGDWDGRLPDLSGALDVDIENSPLTNTMPILRHGLQSGGAGDFRMAFVTMPCLRVEASPQRYEHIRRGESGAVGRYIGLGTDLIAHLELGEDGRLIFSPRPAPRIEPRERGARA